MRRANKPRRKNAQAAAVRAALLQEAQRLWAVIRAANRAGLSLLTLAEHADTYRRTAKALEKPMPKAMSRASHHATAAYEAALQSLWSLIAGSRWARTPLEWSYFIESIPLACELLVPLANLRRMSAKLPRATPLRDVESFRKPTKRHRAR